MRNLLKTLAGSFIAMLITIHAGAQDALKDTLSEADYNFYVPKHVVNVYSNFVPFVLFGILLLAICYTTYRYWADNRPEHDDFPHHGLGH